MNTDAQTILKMLRKLHSEIERCFQNESGQQRAIFSEDPPLPLGDFIVRAYNAHLSALQELFPDDTLLKQMISLQPWQEQSQSSHDRYLGRLGKMREVAIASEQLMLYLTKIVEDTVGAKQDELDAAISVIEALGETLQRNLHPEEGAQVTAGVVMNLVMKYNSIQNALQSLVDGDVFVQLFPPIESIPSDAEPSTCEAKLHEIWLAQQGLLKYANKCRERME